ncbi:MAG: glutamate mutase L [Chloroflexota bacterium]
MNENSFLAVDFGNVHTRALLIDLVDGIYSLVAQAEEPTTGGFPIGDVGVGFRRAVQQLSVNTGRRFLQQDGTIITPEQPDRSGIDAFVATASIGRALRTVLLGLMPNLSIASAQRAAAGTYVEIVDVLSLDDQRTAEEQLNAIVLARPDLIFIAGGMEDGAREPVLELAQIARLALTLTGTSLNVLYAGNSALVPEIHEIFDGVTTLFVADNVRPSLDGESLEMAQAQLASAFNASAEQRGLGFDEVGMMSNVGVLPTAQSYHSMISYLGQTAVNGGVLAVDVGSAVSTLSASVAGYTATTIRTDIGVGHSAASLLNTVDLHAVRAWLPFYVSDNEIRAYALNKSLRPASIPETQRALYLEHALLRAALSALLAAARPSWTPTRALDDLNQPMPYFERIIGAGGALTGTGRPALAVMLLLDALQPVGVLHLQADGGALIPALGALARIKPEAVVQVLDARGLENLCTVVNLSGVPRKGQTAATVRITSGSGESLKFTVPGGDLWVYPLSAGVQARVRISVGRGLSIGGKRQVRLDIDGGTAGLVIDARGRPLPLATSLKALALQIPAWYAQVTGDPRFEVPADWLTSIIVEPDIISVSDRRSDQHDRAHSARARTKATGRVRGGLFGRGAKSAAEQVKDAEAEEGDPDDIRSLLS